MRIIKMSDDNEALFAIAGEMVNIETGLYYFHNGTLLEPPYTAYPNLDDEYIYKSSIGSIYLPQNTSITETRLYDALQMMYTKLPMPHLQLSQYQPVYISYFTCINAVSCQTKTFFNNDNMLLTMKPHNMPNAQRQFVRSFDDQRRGRFTWILQYTDEIIMNDDKILSDLYYAKYISSVVYDKNNKSTHPHNANIFSCTEHIRLV